LICVGPILPISRCLFTSMITSSRRNFSRTVQLCATRYLLSPRPVQQPLSSTPDSLQSPPFSPEIRPCFPFLGFLAVFVSRGKCRRSLVEVMQFFVAKGYGFSGRVEPPPSPFHCPSMLFLVPNYCGDLCAFPWRRFSLLFYFFVRIPGSRTPSPAFAPQTLRNTPSPPPPSPHAGV